MGNVISAIPDFTDGGTPDGERDAKVLDKAIESATTDVVPDKETETPVEPPATTPDEGVQKPADGLPPVQDTGQQQLQQALQGLQADKAKLLQEIATLRGQKREIKQEQLDKVQTQLDDLKDVNPEDATYIERILRAKGYVTREEQQKMFYDAVKQEEINRFLEQFPEYKPENDPNDINWNALQREVSYYRLPDDPHKIREILERAHRSTKQVSPPSSGPSVPAKKRQVELAGVGAGGTQRSSSSAIALDADKKAMLRAGGFTDEDIKNMEKRLTN